MIEDRTDSTGRGNTGRSAQDVREAGARRTSFRPASSSALEPARTLRRRLVQKWVTRYADKRIQALTAAAGYRIALCSHEQSAAARKSDLLGQRS